MKRDAPNTVSTQPAGSVKQKKTAVAAVTSAGEQAGPGGRADRVGKVLLGAWVDKRATVQFQKIMLKRITETDKKTTIRELIKEAYNDFFKKNDLPPVA
jgi:hypothetical protein